MTVRICKFSISQKLPESFNAFEKIKMGNFSFFSFCPRAWDKMCHFAVTVELSLVSNKCLCISTSSDKIIGDSWRFTSCFLAFWVTIWRLRRRIRQRDRLGPNGHDLLASDGEQADDYVEETDENGLTSAALACRIERHASALNGEKNNLFMTFLR